MLWLNWIRLPSSVSEIYRRMDRELAVEEARANRLLSLYRNHDTVGITLTTDQYDTLRRMVLDRIKAVTHPSERAWLNQLLTTIEDASGEDC